VARLVLVELALLAAGLVLGRLLGLLRELLRTHLGNRINVRILEKALSLELRHFEDADVYDKMQNARREASSRPLSLVMQAFGVAQSAVTLAALSVLLWRLSPWSVLVILAASIPAFVAEARLSAESFRVNTWRAPEGRRLNYLEWILTRDSHVKEVKLFDLGPLVLGRYRELFSKFYAEDRRLAVRRLVAGTGFGILALVAFYGMYLLVADRAARGEISLGDMTLYLVVFRQGQAAFQGILSAVGAMYEDALYMSNLFAFLAIPTSGEVARVDPPATAPRGAPLAIAFEDVSFRYPSRPEWALRNVTLRLEPGETLGLVGENGAGKSTLVKLLLRLYDPTEGRITYGGVDLRDLDPLPDRGGIPGLRPLPVHRRREHRLREPGPRGRSPPHRRGGPPRRRRGAPGFLAQRARHRARRLVRERARDLGRAVAEARGGPGLHARRRGPGARRAHRQHRRRVGARALRAVPRTGRGADRHRHLPPLLHRPHRRPDRRPARRTGGGAGKPPGTRRAGRPLCPPLLAAGPGVPGLEDHHARRRADPLAVRHRHGGPREARPRPLAPRMVVF
jgi:energy-coupling factor transporter ATP-binding protein EcfA2